MIERMKKLTFLVTDQEYDSFLAGLREQGVVHVQQLKQGATSPALQEAIDLKQRIQQDLAYLEYAWGTWGKHTHTTEPAPATSDADGMQMLERVEALRDKEVATCHAIDEASKNVSRMEPWGDFDWAAVRRIEEETGLKVWFYACGNKSYNPAWEETYFTIPVSDWQKRLYFVAFSPEEPDIQAELLELPSGTLSLYQQQLAEAEQSLAETHDALCMLYQQRSVLEREMNRAQSEIQLHRVELSDEALADGAVRLMVGWTLEQKAPALTQWLDQQGIYYEIEDPALDEDVPVKITNNSFSSLFEPILRMYSLPSYQDLDPTFYFAPFFMLFFGLCLGDGGYGLLVLIGGLLLAWKGQGDAKAYGRLGAWLGGMTVICGLATGTVFGIDLTQQDWAFLAPVKKYFISDNGIGPIFGYSPMMVLSVAIGLVQVLLGMVLKAAKAIKNYGFAYAIGTLSWVVAIVAAIVLFGLPACGVELPMVLQYILYALIGLSVLGIFFYNNPASYRRPALGLLSNIGGGVWSTYSMATGLLGDLLSYIRLFALGLTGGVLGGVFNTLALDMTSSMPWYIRWLPLIIILLFGHGITFALSMISAFVHPMRLTFVEFFKNADYSGGGEEYDPFKK